MARFSSGSIGNERSASDPARLDRALWWMFLLAAGLPRFWALDLRPLHHDEGSNAIFILRLLDQGTYHYDPTNYHGPLLFYLSALALALFGTNTLALRVVPALVGSLMAPLAWSLRPQLGRPAAGSAALLIACSPALVYYSRDNIHEIYFVFLTLALVVALTRLEEAGARGWIIASGITVGALVATKETAPIALAAIGLGMAAAGRRPMARAGRGGLLMIGLMACLVVCLFYTDGLRNLADLAGPLRAVRPWTVRAVGGEGHTKPWWYFVHLLARAEAPLLGLGLAGGVVAAWRRLHGEADRLAPARLSGVMPAVWLGTSFVVYSLIPYKTPWLCLNLVVPLALLAGQLLSAGFESRRGVRRAAAAVGLVAAAALSLESALRVSLRAYDDEREPLVYVQTSRDALRLVARLETIAARAPESREIPIAIVSPDYLPLNWYLRDFTQVGYHGRLVDRLEEPLVIARADQVGQVADRLGPEYERDEYDLRPGVRLTLFMRRDLWQDDGAERTHR